MSNITKSAELAILDAAIAQLGRQSYLGPWLADIRAGVELDIRSDLPVTRTLGEHKAYAEHLVQQAQVRAEEILSSATKQAAKANAELVKTQERARRLRDAIENAKGTLSSALLSTY